MKALLMAAMILALAAPADAKRKRNPTSIEPVTTTTNPYFCGTWCAPQEWTPIDGTPCDFYLATCIWDDGVPNCAWSVKSCD